VLKWNYQNTIVWNKNVFGLSGHKGYRPKYELLMFLSFGINYNWYAGNDQSNVWDVARPNINERAGNHRTPKPILIPGRAIQNSTKAGDLVLDIFAGSGSTMVACEQTGRVCYAMEIEPDHCESILQRMKALQPGIKIKKNGVEI
jgi:DNA modification methylase